MQSQDLNLLFAQVFSYHRMKLGISQIELSQRLGISQTTLHFIETGQRPAQMEWVEDLAKLVGISVEDLVINAMMSNLLKI